MLFWGICLNPTEFVPSAVQFVSAPEVGVPSTGVVRACEAGSTTVPVNVGEARGALRLSAVVTKAVVAMAVVLLPAVCVVAIVPVGRVGLPVKVGEARGALASRAVCNPEVLAIDSAASAIAVAFPVEVTTPVRLAFVVTVVASATAILAVPSKEVPPIVRAVVSLGAETIVMTGVVVVVATVASELAEVTDVTVPEPPPAIKVGADVVPALVRTVPLAHNATAVYTQVFPL